MKRVYWRILLLTGALFGMTLPAHAGPALPAADLSSLIQVSTVPVEVTWDARTGWPSFVAGQFPSGTTRQALLQAPLRETQAFLAIHQPAFAAPSHILNWALMRVDVDAMDRIHVRLQQTVNGVPVLGAQRLLHFDPTGAWVTAINGTALPDLSDLPEKPELTVEQALAVARAALPQGRVWQAPRLVVADGRLVPPVSGTHLAWEIELYDPGLPARLWYLVDAQTGQILHSFDRLTTDRNRRTYTAENKWILPGKLWLTENGPVSNQTPDEDGINAHLFAADTYDYFFNTFGRDSFDDNGAAIVSSVHYGRDLENAAWNGFQMIYGDGFADANDVVAHELTHAVTEHTADLVYQFQSGALNESFSDIFGAMVDDEDWLLGEDLPIGAIRSLSNPAVFGHPEHVDQYNTTCRDNGGVHINSGIPNKAAYLLAEEIGRPAAAQIFYRSLTYYLTSTAEFNDARAGALQAARDLFGPESREVKATADAFMAVGLDGVRTPPAPACGCAIFQTLADPVLFADREWVTAALATFYRVRDARLAYTPQGRHYIDLYYTHTDRISQLLARDPALRAQAAHLLRASFPGLVLWMSGQGERVKISPALLEQLQTFLDALARADAGGPLARTIAVERARLNLDQWGGITFEQAWQILNRPPVQKKAAR